MYTLKDVPIGDTVTVVKLYAAGAIKRRLMDMGITRHTKIQVRKTAPLGDPLELNLRGYELTMRKADAALIEVSALETLDLTNLKENSSCH